MHYALIYNPVAGKKKSTVIATKLSQRLKARSHTVELVATHADPAVFHKTCRKLAPDTIAVVIGGDGTLCSFVQSRATVAGIAFFGIGTANVLSIELGLPRNTKAFVKMLEDGHTAMLKPGIADDQQLFMMMYSIGLDSYVLAQVVQSHKNVIGKLAFLLPALRSMRSYTYPPCQLVLDEGEPIEAYFAVVSRIRHYAGPYIISPGADLRSDYLEVFVLQKRGFFPFLNFFIRLMLGGLKKPTHFFRGRARTVKCLPTTAKTFAQIDGDPLEFGFETLSVSPQALPFIVPRP